MKRDVSLILLFDDEGKVLLQLRDMAAPTYPGFWGIFGGGIEIGETPKEAVIRECHEELRYVPKLQNEEIILDYEDSITGRSGRKFYFYETCDKPYTLELNEGAAMKWFRLDEVEKIRTTNMNKIMIRRASELLFPKPPNAGAY